MYAVTIRRPNYGSIGADEFTRKGRTDWETTATNLYNDVIRTPGERRRHLALKSRLDDGLYEAQFGYRMMIQGQSMGINLDSTVIIRIDD